MFDIEVVFQVAKVCVINVLVCAVCIDCAQNLNQIGDTSVAQSPWESRTRVLPTDFNIDFLENGTAYRKILHRIFGVQDYEDILINESQNSFTVILYNFVPF